MSPAGSGRARTVSLFFLGTLLSVACATGKKPVVLTTDPLTVRCPGATLSPSTSPVMHYDEAPKGIKITRPKYPKDAFAKKITGVVTIEILIDAEGLVAQARVLDSIPLLDNAAVETVCQWRFQPAIKDGHPVPTMAHAPVKFGIYY